MAPFAAAAKLTGVGVGVGLAVVFALERRWGALAVAVASLGLAAMTVPFFNATLGAYSFYAIDVQRAHPIEWAKLATLASTAHVQITIGVAVLLAWARWLEPVPGLKVGDSDSVRVGLLTAVCAVASLPAWLKYAGRDNNLALLAVGATCAGLLGIAAHVSRGGATIHPALGPAAALLGLTILAPPISPFLGPARAAACSDAATIERAVREDDQAGRHTLAMPSVARWIAAGHRDVPPDRIQSAIELFYAEAPAADLLFSHIEDGRYDSVVVMVVTSPLGLVRQPRLAATVEREVLEWAIVFEANDDELVVAVKRRVFPNFGVLDQGKPSVNPFFVQRKREHSDVAEQDVFGLAGEDVVRRLARVPRVPGRATPAGCEQ